MPVKSQTPTQEQVEKLRNLFSEKYDQNPPQDKFHPVDIDRVMNSDIWCVRFLEMYDLDMNTAFENLWNTCIWRQKFGANDLNESNIRMDYVTQGAIFTRNVDVDGKPLLIFKVKLHTKGTKNMDDVIRIVVYWVERIHRETNMSQITLFFDMDGTGLSNMDIDFIKGIIDTFKLYYPNSLNYILVFELAWILNAVFKIIKGLLPPKAIEILKLITKKDINKYIDKNNCLASWGGNDSYTFEFVPEKPNIVADDLNNNNNNSMSNNVVHDKKVRFVKNVDTIKSNIKMPKNPEIMLQITPNEYLQFSQGENSDAVIDITCLSKFPVMYKIQTTSPEKFRVRPRCGVIKPNQSVSVNILLKAEHRLNESSKDKFLVMSLPAPMELDLSSPQNIAEVWRQKPSNSADIEQHRLCCTYKTSEHARSSFGHSEQVDLKKFEAYCDNNTSALSELSRITQKLEKQLKLTQMLQYIMLFFLLIMSVAVVYLLRLEMNSATMRSSTSSAGPCKHQ